MEKNLLDSSWMAMKPAVSAEEGSKRQTEGSLVYVRNEGSGQCPSAPWRTRCMKPENNCIWLEAEGKELTEEFPQLRQKNGLIDEVTSWKSLKDIFGSLLQERGWLWEGMGSVSLKIEQEMRCTRNGLRSEWKRETGWGRPSHHVLEQGSQVELWSFESGKRSVQFSRSVMSDSLRPHESQHPRPPCPSPTTGVHSDSRPPSQWCHPAISSSVVPFSSCPQFLPASESFPMSQLFTWGGQSTGVSASASFPPKKSQGWSLEWTGWISLQSKGLSRVFSNTTVQKHQFFGPQPSSQSNSHIHTWPQEKP